LKNKNSNEIFKNLKVQNNFLYNNINKTEKTENEKEKKYLDKGFIMENNSHLHDENSQLSKKDEEKIYHISKKMENIKTTYMTTIGNPNNNIS
jgi:hypothetical protein